MQVGGAAVHPGVVHADIASALSSLPTPLLATLAFLLACLLLLAGASIRNRVRARRAELSRGPRWASEPPPPPTPARAPRADARAHGRRTLRAGRAVVGDAADRGDRLLRHVLRQRRAEPRIDDDDRDGADARAGCGRGGGDRAPAARGRCVEGRYGLWPVGLLLAFTALTALSVVWSVQPDDSWQDAGRMLAYSGVFGASVALVRLAPERWPAILGGLALAAVIVCGYALLTKVFPGKLAPARTTCTRAWRNRTATGTRSA